MELTDNEVRLLIDVLKGEEMRLHVLRREDPASVGVLEGSWFESRVVDVAAIKDRLKGERFRRSTPPADIPADSVVVSANVDACDCH